MALALVAAVHLLAVHHRPGEGDLLEGLPLPGGRGLGRRPDAGPLGHLGLDEGHHPPSPRVPGVGFSTVANIC